MADDRTLVDAVARLSALATTDFGPDEMLGELCRTAAEVMCVDGAGVMGVAEDDGRRPRGRFVDAVGPGAAALEELQEALQAGPCRAAMDTEDVVVVDDVAAARDVWPAFVTEAVAQAVGAVLAVPLRSRGRVWGSLDLFRRERGAWTRGEVRAARLLADLAVSYLVVADDRDRARAEHRAVAHRALHDPLTGLPNRALLRDRLQHALAVACRTGAQVAVAFLDLDRFKEINDTRGHAAGDAVLVEVARRLSAAVRSADTLCRFAGDELVLLLDQLPDDPVEVVDALAVRLSAAMSTPVTVGAAELRVTMSAGIAIMPVTPATTVDAVLEAADAAMYEAKARGGDAVVVHDHGHDASWAARLRQRDGRPGVRPGRGPLTPVHQVG